MWESLWHRLATTIHRKQEWQASRRAFLRVLSLASASYFLASIPVTVRAFMPSPTVRKRVLLTSVQQVPVGEAITFHYPGPDDPAILLRLGDDTWRAYSQKCTHLQCPVHWQQEERVLLCPCHEGFFDPQTGAPRQGPPQRPLPAIALEVVDGNVYALGKKVGARA